MKKELEPVIKKINKPIPFIAFGSSEPVTPEEIEKRKRIIERAEELGINITGVDTENEYENPYKVEALIYIMDDKNVPEDLIKKIQEFEMTHEKSEAN